MKKLCEIYKKNGYNKKNDKRWNNQMRNHAKLKMEMKLERTKKY